MAIKTIYDELLPNVKTSLQDSAKKYSTAKRLKYNLMSKTMWSDLTVQDLSDIITYSNLNNSELSPHSYLFGYNIISK
jgi:hypothetical protein